MGQKSLYFLSSHVIGMTFVVKKDKATDPSEVRFLGVETQVSQTDGVAYLIKQLRFWLHTPSCVSMLMERLRQESPGRATCQKMPSDLLLHAVMDCCCAKDDSYNTCNTWTVYIRVVL